MCKHCGIVQFMRSCLRQKCDKTFCGVTIALCFAQSVRTWKGRHFAWLVYGHWCVLAILMGGINTHVHAYRIMVSQCGKKWEQIVV